MDGELTLSFARRFRPVRLKDFIGNETIKKVIETRIRSKNKPQAILLLGNTGCGKTTLNRLIIKEYMCENPSEDEGACGVCATCRDIDEYIKTGIDENISDVQEIDVSEKSGKKDIDALLEDIDYPSMLGGWKVYCFDECHAASKEAMSRLLKVVEEPPEKVLLIFSTTDPQKMLETLKNRMQLKLQVTKPSLTDAMKLLQRVCVEEEVEYDSQGLRALAVRSGFVIRDMLNYVERVILAHGNALGESVYQEFQEISEEVIKEFFRAYLNNNYMGYVKILYKIKTDYGFEGFVDMVTNFVTRGIYIYNGIDVNGMSKEEIAECANLFKDLSVVEIGHILSELKKMMVGDIETNLLQFIYQRGKEEEESGFTWLCKKSEAEMINEESAFRNSNIKELEKFKEIKGSDAVANLLTEVSMEDSFKTFNLEKVKED